MERVIRDMKKNKGAKMKEEWRPHKHNDTKGGRPVKGKIDEEVKQNLGQKETKQFAFQFKVQ